MHGQQQRIATIIEAFDAQGWHRTGTGVDAASAEWLADCVAGLGLRPELEPYPLLRLEPVTAFVEDGGNRVEGLPLFDGGLTGAEGVEGQLGLLGSDVEISVAEASLGTMGLSERYESARRRNSHRAIVVATVGGRPGLIARNAHDFARPFGPPVLQVSSTVLPWLQHQAAAGARARVVVHASREDATSANVVVCVKGRDPAAPVVVTTPRSSWWQCAGERGGGIACWLEVMRRVSMKTPVRDVWFAAFSGHELGHLGLDAFLAERPGFPARSTAWLHFGANVGAALESAVRISASDAEYLELALTALAEAGVAGVLPMPAGTVIGMESRVAHDLGGRCVGVAGGNALVHLIEDRWPAAVDVDAVSRQASAFAALVERLASPP